MGIQFPAGTISLRIVFVDPPQRRHNQNRFSGVQGQETIHQGMARAVKRVGRPVGKCPDGRLPVSIIIRSAKYHHRIRVPVHLRIAHAVIPVHPVLGHMNLPGNPGPADSVIIGSFQFVHSGQHIGIPMCLVGSAGPLGYAVSQKIDDAVLKLHPVTSRFS